MRGRGQDHKKKKKAKEKSHSVSRFESVQDSDSNVLNCHGQKLAHPSKMQCQTNLHFIHTKTNVYLVSFFFFFTVLTM